MHQAPSSSQFSPGPPTEASPPARDGAPIEAQLVKLGLLTVAQLAEANRERFQSGRSVLEIVQERGWISQKDMEVLFGEAAPPPSELAPQVAAEPDPTPPVAAAPEPVLAPARRFNVAIRLVDGEFVEVTTADGEDAAHSRALEVVADLSRPREGDWPFYGGRFLKPDAIVSVDVVEEELG
jgi:hypothetical protein